MIRRHVNIPKKNHFFLFGARGTGKSTLLSQEFSAENSLWFNLLERTTEQKLSTDLGAFEREILTCGKQITHIIVDEIQILPQLLNSVHNLIETHKIKQNFALTGSSARKLKKGGANLLAGRAVFRELFPFSADELGEFFNLNDALQFGTLPRIWNSTTEFEKNDALRSYAHVYLKEEVWAEHLVRKLDPFRLFLEVAAKQSGKILNHSKIARDSGTNDNTIRTWYSILEDTLVGFHLEAFNTSIRKQLRSNPKFYFFDTGVTRALANFLNVAPSPRTSYYGDLFEQFIICEVHKKNKYNHLDYKLSYLKTKADLEIDLILERPGKNIALIEIKSTHQLKEEHFLQLKNFENDFPRGEFFLFSQDPKPQQFGKILALPWWEGLKLI